MHPTAPESIWENVRRLLEREGHGSDPSLDTVHKAIKRKVGRGQLQRLAQGDNVTLKTVEALAAALGVPMWQLVQPAGHHVRESEGSYSVTHDGALVAVLAEILARLPAEQRTPAADLVSAWIRTGVDEGRSAVLLSMLRTKQLRAA